MIHETTIYQEYEKTYIGQTHEVVQSLINNKLIMINEKELKSILKFLWRADLKWTEVIEFVDCINYINSELGKLQDSEQVK